MSRLEALKEEFAKSQLFDTWKRLKYFYKDDQDAFEKVLDEINSQYAKECAKASIELSKENTSWFINSDDCGRVESDDYHNILEMIENPNNIVLL